MAPRPRSSLSHSSSGRGRGRGRGAYYAAKYGSRGAASASRDGLGTDGMSLDGLGTTYHDGRDNSSSGSGGGGNRGRLGSRSRSSHDGFGAGSTTSGSNNNNNNNSYNHGPDVAVPTFENGDLNELSTFLKSVDNTPYPNYKPLKGSWRISDTLLLIFDQIQGDAYAAPSRARLRVPLVETGFPDFLFSSAVRVVAFCDYISRKFAHFAAVARLDYQRVAKGWASAKGGHVSIDAPLQHVVPRTSCVLDDGGKTLELRIAVALPARGRTIEGHVADEALTQILPVVAEKALYAQGDDAERCGAHVRCVDEQEELRRKLPSLGLVGFVVEGAILPRAGGDSDLPMDATQAIKFRPPANDDDKKKNGSGSTKTGGKTSSMATSIRLSTGRTLRGMAIRPGVNLIVGGGFHGKSTLLAALQVGVYNHVPGDGREFVTVVPDAVSIRAEDGRYVVGVDISPFIGTLPFGKRTDCFSTPDASGSTSQAANIIEALDAGAKLLLIDEDLSATNLMIRDRRMQKLVPRNKEPITPMIDRIRALCDHEGVSTIMVVGGAGDYFDVADAVVMMDSYCPTDVTQKARQIARDIPSTASSPSAASGKKTASKTKASAKKQKKRKKDENDDDDDDDDDDDNDDDDEDGDDGDNKDNVVVVPNTRHDADVFKSKRRRRVAVQSLQWLVNSGRGKVFARIMQVVEVGAERIDLSAVVQLVETGQTRAIGAALEVLADMSELQSQGVAACIQKLFMRIDREGLDVLNVRGERMGNYARPRPYELHAALNRLRGLQISDEK